MVKSKCKHPFGLLHSIVIPEWKWEVISMEFITSFPKTYRQHGFIMVAVDRLTKVAHFIPVKTTCLASNVAQVFIRDVIQVRLCQKEMKSSLPSFGRSCL